MSTRNQRKVLILIFAIGMLCTEVQHVLAEGSNTAGLGPLNGAVPSKCVKTEDGKVYVDALYPVGFSTKGLFAYIVWQANWGCGVCPSLVIQDLVNDETVKTLNLQLQEGSPDPESPVITPFINAHKGKILEALKQFGIEPVANLRLSRFPLVAKEERIEAVIAREPLDIKHDEVVEKPERQRLVLMSSFQGQKEIALNERIMLVHDDFETVEGYFKSQFEDRIAIVVSGSRYILEHDFQCGFQIFGAHLKVGFKKQVIGARPQ